MRNKDVIYASNSTTVDAAKAMTFFNLVMGTANNPITTALNIYALKFAIAGTAPSVITGVTGGVTTTP